MRIAILSKARNGPLMEFLRDAGVSQAEFARRTGIPAQRVNALATLRFRDVSANDLAAVSEATGISMEELIPTALRRWSPNKPMVGFTEVEVPVSVLLDLGVAVPELVAPESTEQAQWDLRDEVASLMNSAGVTRRERTVINSRFGLNGAKPKTLAATGKRIGRTRERVRQIELGAMAKLKRAANADHAFAERMCVA